MRRFLSGLVATAAVTATFTAPLLPTAIAKAAPVEAPPALEPPDPSGDLDPGLTELPALRTASSNTYATGTPGEYETHIFPGNINYQRSDGTWERIDRSLQLQDNGSYQTAASDTVLRVNPPDTSATDVAKLTLPSGHSVQFGLQGSLPDAALTVVDNVAQYQHVLPDTDLQLDGLNQGVKETLWLNSPLAPHVFVFPLTLEGLTAQITANGGIDYVNAAGDIEAFTPTGLMTDSGPNSANSEGVTYSLVDGPAPAVVVSLDDAWLDDPARVYPVLVDPTVTSSADLVNDTFVSEDSPTWGGSSETHLHIGYGNPPGGSSAIHRHIAFLHFNAGPAAGDAIDSATFKFWNWNSGAPCQSKLSEVKRVTSAWGVSSVTWNTVVQNGTVSPGNGDPSYTGLSGASETHSYDSDSSSCGSAYLNYDVTQLIRNWTNDPIYSTANWTNHGIAVVAGGSPTDNSFFKGFPSMENGSHVPWISITHHDATPPPAPTLTQKPNSCSASPFAQFTWTMNDDAGHDAAGNHANATSFSLDTTDDPSRPNLSANATTDGSPSTYTYTSPQETDGQYYFHVRNRDADGNWSNSIQYGFKIDTTGPGAPQNLTNTSAANSSTFSASWSPPSGSDLCGLNGYYVWFDNNFTPVSVSGTSYSTTVADGNHTFHVRAVDGAGNASVSADLSFTKDTVAPPAPTLTASPAGCTSNTSATFSWSTSDNANGSGVVGSSYVLDQTAGTTPDATIDTTAGTASFSGLSPSANPYWFHVRNKDATGNWSPVTQVSFTIDNLGPPAPNVTSSTHPNQSAWYSSPNFAASWGQPSDPCGISNYTVSLDSGPTATQPASNRSYSASGVSDGTHVFHVHGTDGAGNVGSDANYTFKVDATCPTNPTAFQSDLNHVQGQPSADNTIDVTWSPGTDSTSGIAGYSLAFNNSQATAADSTPDTSATATTATSVPLADGTWYAHIRSVDNAGNACGDVAIGPFIINTGGPSVVKHLIAPSQAPSGATNVTAGQYLTYQVDVTNSTTLDMLPPDITDSIDTGQQLTGADPAIMLADGSVVHCLRPNAVPSCAIEANGTRLHISSGGPFIGPNQSIHLTYTTLAVGVPGGCALSTNTATAINGTASGQAAPVQVQICDSGLGLENWWSYTGTPVSASSSAQVNVMNGNMVLEDTDGTGVPGRGHLAYLQRRIYNSQDLSLPLAGGWARGWMFTIGQTESIADGGVSADGLVVPTVNTNDPTASALPPAVGVTLIDRDGTRHVFTYRSASIDVDHAVDISALPTGPASVLRPVNALLQPGTGAGFSGFTHVCVDATYQAPAGVHLSLWRYVGTNGNCTGTQTDTAARVLGYAAIRPDRLRTEFDAYGRLVDMADGSGVDLRYVYETVAGTGAALPTGRLTQVYEPRSCTGGIGSSTCRATRITYSDTSSNCSVPSFSGVTLAVCVTDPANRVTVYGLNDAHYLLAVVNPPETGNAGSGGSDHTLYTYSGVNGATSCGGAVGTLCTVTDNRQNTTSLAYQNTGLIGASRVASFTDRRSTTTNLTYNDAAHTVTADTLSHRIRYTGIDSAGRVGEIDEGDTANTWLRQTRNTWDTAADSGNCTFTSGSTTGASPTKLGGPDNELCQQDQLDPASGAVLASARYAYNPQGAVLSEAHLVSGSNYATTTYGYDTQYAHDNNASSTVVSDTPTGSGGVNVGDHATALADPHLLFAVSDHTATLSPNGNDAAAGYSAYETTFQPARATGGQPSTAPSVPSSCATRNTGELCSESDPVHGGFAVTNYTYDTFGQRLTATRQQAPGGTTIYSYYDGTSHDLSGTVSSDGWLKAITDATGHFVYIAYDQAGNPTRTWDRNRTNGQTVAAFSTATSGYAQTLHATGVNALPWRYVLSTTDPMGNTTSYTVDPAGDRTGITDARGNTAVQVFDENSDLQSSAAPADPSKPHTYIYDAFGNVTRDTTPEGGVTLRSYDAVDRLTDTVTDRGAGSVGNQTGCRTSTSTDAPIATGHVVCTTHTAYDGIDNPVSTTDGAGTTSIATYDGLHRQTSRTVPRSSSVNEIGRTVYDDDGNVTDSCPPRSAADGGASSCTSSDPYGTHHTYDPADRTLTATHYRSTTGAALTTSYSYDAYGNLTAATDPNGHTTTNTYDALDRLTAATVPRNPGVDITTRYTYDPVGNRTSISTPGVDAGDGQGADLTINGNTYPKSNPYPLPNNASYHSLTLTNGGWATAATTSPRPVLLNITVQGKVTICATCGITVDGLGYRGGNGGINGDVNGHNGSGPGGGGGSVANTRAAGGGAGAGHQHDGAAGAFVAFGGVAGYPGAKYPEDPVGSTRDAGSGGGGAGQSGTSVEAQNGGGGGDGGGAIHLTADTLINNGTISAAGLDGVSPAATAVGASGGGGGSGGSIWLTTDSLTRGTLDVSGGAGGVHATGGVDGGVASQGMLRLDNAAGDSTTGAGISAHTTARLTLFTYDKDNRLVDTINGATSTSASWRAASSDGGADIRSRQAYDADGNIVATYDPRAFTASATPNPSYSVRYDYDADSRLIAEYHPRYDTSNATDTGLSSTQTDLCQTTQPTSTAVPAIANYTAGTGVCVTRYGYDADGNRTLTTLPTSTGSDNRKLTYHYTPDDLLDHVNGPDPRATHAASLVTVNDLAYDGDGRPVSSTTASGVTATTTYTLDGLTKTVTTTSGDQPHTTTYSYDPNGAPTSRTQTITTSASQTDNVAVYNTDGTLASVADAAGNTTSYRYDPAGNTTSVYSPDANTTSDTANTADTPTRYTYTDDNLVATMTVPISADGTTLRRTSYHYDLGGRRTSTDIDEVDNTGTVTRNGAPQRLAYYPDDRLASQTGRNNETDATQYDPAGNPTTLTYTPTNGDPTVTTTGTYYLDGLPRTVGERGHTTRYSYDAAGALAAQADAATNTTTTTYTLTDAEEPASISSDVTGNQAITLDYDIDGRPHTTTYPNGTSWTRTYNADGTLASQDLAHSGTDVANWQYKYDGLARTTAAGLNAANLDCTGTPTAGLQCFGYNNANRLTSFADNDGTRTATYDPDGNRLAYGISDTSTVAKTLHQTYNADDSTHTITTGSGSSTTLTYTVFGGRKTDDCATYTYDGLDHLTGRATTDTTKCGPATTYTYDGLDRQTTINQTGGPTATAGTTRLHYLGWTPSLALETEPNGDDTTYAQGTSLPVAAKRTAIQYLASDGHGNIVTSTSSGGALACQWRFDPWGTPLHVGQVTADQTCTNDNGSALTNVSYANTRRDTASGNYELGARTYNPTTSSFLTSDSYARGASTQDAGVGIDPLTHNTYNYVNGDPINYIDPTGHMPCVENVCGSPQAIASALSRSSDAQAQQQQALQRAHVDAARCAYMNQGDPYAQCMSNPTTQALLFPPLSGSICSDIPTLFGQHFCSAASGMVNGFENLWHLGADASRVIGDLATGRGHEAIADAKGAARDVGHTIKGLAHGAQQLATDAYNLSPAGVTVNTLRYGPTRAWGMTESSAGDLAPAALVALATGGAGDVGAATEAISTDAPAVVSDLDALGPTVPYNRAAHYGGAATSSPSAQAIREAGEGQLCPSCGNPMLPGTRTAPIPQHAPPLVMHYYDYEGWRLTPEEARAYARSADAFDGAMCAMCQSAEGGTLSVYSQLMKQMYGLDQ